MPILRTRGLNQLAWTLIPILVIYHWNGNNAVNSNKLACHLGIKASFKFLSVKFIQNF